MGFLSSQALTLPDGTPIFLRTPGLADARRILHYRRSEAKTHDFEVVTAEEIKDDDDLQRKWLFNYIQDPNKLCLIAEHRRTHDPEVIAMLDFYAHPWRRIAHHGTMGIGVALQWRGRGIGTAMIKMLIQWVEAHPTLEKIYLGVWANNLRAQALYTSLGFYEECRRKEYFKLAPNEYVDDIVMVLPIKRL
jgi:RimJ/RimL family protein N-acetyltransferase